MCSDLLCLLPPRLLISGERIFQVWVPEEDQGGANDGKDEKVNPITAAIDGCHYEEKFVTGLKSQLLGEIRSRSGIADMRDK